MGLFDRLRGDDGPRVAFVGIDGVPWSLIEDNPETFPNLTAMAEDGAGGPMNSIVPPESSACWPALTTGTNPGKTGVYGFQDREVGSYDTYVPMGNDVQSTRLWNRVVEADRNATVMNVPVTFPPDREPTRMVSGFLSPSVEKAAVPASFASELESMGYRIDVNAKLGHDADKTEFIQDAFETLEARYQAFERYVEEGDWDLFFGVFMTTDRVNHFLFEEYERDGEYHDEFLEFYATVDSYLGALREKLPADTTMVVASDHGFTTLDYEVHLNTWLQEAGWLSFESEDPEDLSDIASETTAYSFIPGRFYLNLDGREPRGSVPESEYESVRADLKAEIESLTGPDGRPVVDRVVPKEEAFAGDHDDIAPDLIAIPNDGFDLKSGFTTHENVFDKGPRNGMHTFEEATLIVDDPSVSIPAETDLLDIAPTILDLLDLDPEVPEFDGESRC
ncbi:alkaline phosphatase family protein [Halodesulfurarchaeum formicicum]|uniref:alkaline phosphatase family protein n=1 Tax=Halodesulfurarchaeum formicicum TaxID=1873524 RepID=UPI0008785B06|nr:alkaline phosphatase family protein [Halodesulfurarchaeum formicicum]